MSSKPTSAPPRRPRTDPTLKWLLNERAALAGIVQGASEPLPELEAAVRRAQLHLQEAESRFAAARSVLDQAVEKLCAFDSTISQVNPEVDPAYLGTIRAWQGRFGKRGALSSFLLERVKHHAPNPVSLAQLCDEVEEHFSIVPSGVRARKKLYDSVRTCVRQLHDKLGSIAPYRHPTDQQPGHWIWVSGPSFDQLKQQASQAKAGVHEFDPFAQFSAPAGVSGSAPASSSDPAHECHKLSAAPRSRRSSASHQDPSRN